MREHDRVEHATGLRHAERAQLARAREPRDLLEELLQARCRSRLSKHVGDLIAAIAERVAGASGHDHCLAGIGRQPLPAA